MNQASCNFSKDKLFVQINAGTTSEINNADTTATVNRSAKSKLFVASIHLLKHNCSDLWNMIYAASDDNPVTLIIEQTIEDDKTVKSYVKIINNGNQTLDLLGSLRDELKQRDWFPPEFSEYLK